MSSVGTVGSSNGCGGAAPIHPWRMTINLSADSFEGLRSIADYVFTGIKNAKTLKELPSAGGGGGVGGQDCSYSVITASPIEVKIKQLRDEADKLEKQLLGE